MADPQSAQAPAAAEQTQEKGLLDQIVEEGRFGAEPAARERGKNLVKEFVAQVLEGSMTIARDAEMMINARIAQIDHLVSIQLNEIMHHPSFQKLEGSWRGVKYLMDQSETGVMLKIKVLNVSKKELLQGPAARAGVRPERAVQEGLRRRVRRLRRRSLRRAGRRLRIRQASRRYGTAGAGFARGRRGARAVPHGGRARPVQPGSFTSLDAPRDLAKIFDTTEYAKWKSFRQTEDSRYVGAVPAPRPGPPALRQRHQAGGSFNYEEHVDGTDHSKYLWMNAAYALAHPHDELVRAVRHVRGHARRGRRRPGGGPAGAQLLYRRRRRGDEVPHRSAHHRPPRKRTRRSRFVPLVHCKDTDYAAFFSVQSAQKPKLYDTDAANANARLSTQIPYIMAVSRFAHYLKAMMRDKIGSFMSRTDAEIFLNRWITNYVIPDDTASPAMKARCPLREARVDVTEVPASPVSTGRSRSCGRTSSWTSSRFARLVADLPAPAK